MDAGDFQGDPEDLELYLRLLQERDGHLPERLKPKPDPEAVQKRIAEIEQAVCRPRRRRAA
ncbi:hypothetical protein [Streptomyces spiramyceticus]|uniref:hypothetical protein n=1 Tax=Streptomyces spiramyceticus TaxID=299717 RepID=UPI00237BB386|nr:hypothetical protein [Streptomyces spiramyceticus]